MNPANSANNNNNMGRPNPTTSWVQLSASGATSLASSGARNAHSPLQPAGSSSSSVSSASSMQQHQQHQHQDSALARLQPVAGDSPRLSFISATTSSSFSISGPNTSTTSSTSMGPYQSRPLIGGRRLASGPGSATSATSSPISSGPSSLVGGVQFSPAPACSSSSSSVYSAGAPGGFLAAGSQQLQQAMSELQLAEQLALGHHQAHSDSGQLEDEERQQEASRKLRLQLYVFVLRCISYPFNAKQTAFNGDPRQQMLKLRKQQFEQIVQLHTRFVESLGGAGCAVAAGSPTPSSSPATASAARQPQPGAGASYQHIKLSQAQVRQLEQLHDRLQVTFNRRFLNNERLRLLVESESCSQADLRDLFRQQAEKILKELQSQAHSQGPSGAGPTWSQLLANKEPILNNWLIRFESIIREDSATPTGTPAGHESFGQHPAELHGSPANKTMGPGSGSANSQPNPFAMTKEQLYQMFQNILTIKKFEHQLLYNALQLDSSDEQAAAIRRELDGRVARIAELERNKKLLPKFVLKEMESLYLEESRMAVNKLMVNLDSLPVLKGGGGGSGSGGSGAGGSGVLGVGVPGLGGSGSAGSASESRVYSGLQKFRRYNSSSQILIGGAGAGYARPGATSWLQVHENDIKKRRQLEAKLRRQYPVSSRLLKRAQMPLWRLTYNSLSSFAKVAAQAALTRDGLAESHPSEPQLSKLDVVLTFNIEVIVMEVRGLRNLVAPQREIYCTMEIEGSERGRLQTEHVPAKKPLWDTQGDFTTNHPLPVLKIKLYAVNPSMLSLEDKELGKLVLRPTVLSPKTPEWCQMSQSSGSAQDKSLASSACSGSSNQHGPGADHYHHHSATSQAGSNDELKIRVIVRMDRPQQLKHCGFLLGIGKSTWRKFKRRYHILIQVSQYTFVMCAYREKKAKPTEMLQLDGYTVDYIEPPTDLIMEHCSEMSTSGADPQLHSAALLGGGAGSSSSSSSSAFGLAGRLAKPFLKQSAGLGGGGGGGLAGGGATSGSGPDSADQGPAAGSGQPGDEPAQPPSAIQTAAALSDELHNKFYFNVVKEGDSVVFACDDQQECHGWVMALYRATGQAHKPTPLRQPSSSSHYVEAAFAYQASGRDHTKLAGLLNGAGPGGGAGSASCGGPGAGPGAGSAAAAAAAGVAGHQAARSSVEVADQRARKHGMDEFIAADPCKFQHNQLFRYLQDETLTYRLADQFCSMGWLAPGQLFVLDEYCARYGVRTCYRHLAYLNSLLDLAARGLFIDHTLLNINYDFCASFVSGQTSGAGGPMNPMSSVTFDLRPDGIGTVTVEERDLFHVVKSKLLKMIELQISNFAYCFPFGKPHGALRATLSLLERVLMKEHQTSSMMQNEEVRQLIRKCLDQAALNNYTKLSGQANLLAPPATGTANQSSADNSMTPVTPTPPPPAPQQQQQQQQAQHKSGNNSPISDLQQAANEQQATPSSSPMDFFGRKRTQSNLSNSSLASGSFASAGSTTGQANLNDSIRRRQQHQQHQKPTNSQEQCLTMVMIINNEQVRPIDKLRYLIRLAELCCEQVEENNEYFGDAFAWHSDLMMDHFELFWSLFSVDMDKIFSELAALGGGGPTVNSQQQVDRRNSSTSSPIAPRSAFGASIMSTSYNSSSDLLGANNREAFALFQILNNHLRKSPNFECKKFKTYLCDTFKPKLLRYIDVMESTLTRLVLKACERDAQINCQLIEQMFSKLDELQKFVLIQLRWPEEQLAEQLLQRLKLMAYELCDASVQRTLQAFQQLEKKSNKWTATTTSYSSPEEMISMINLTLDTRNRSLKLCTFNGYDQMSYHSKIDKLVETALVEMQPGLMAKMLNALDSTLTKLARYDEGNLLAPILSLTYKQGMSSSGKDIGKQYISFVSNCCDLLRHKINDELWIVNLLEDWYAAQMGTICNWLAERIDRSLHDVQLSALTNIMPKIYADMSLQGVSEEKLNIKSYQTIISRLKMEEASSHSSAGAGGGFLFESPGTGSGAQTTSSSIFNSSILSSLTSANSTASSTSSTIAGATAIGQAMNQQSLSAGQSAGSTSIGAASQSSSTPIRRFGSIHHSPPPTTSTIGSTGSGLTSSNTLMSQVSRDQAQLEDGEQNNIADRAFQSATRMFKGFWAS